MSTMTKRDAVDAAMSLAEDVAEGRLAPADLEAQAVTEMRELFGTVIGPDDPLWETQANVTRQAIALGALTADELSEWAAVMRHRAGEPVSELEPKETPPEPVSSVSGPYSPAIDASEAITETPAEAESVVESTPVLKPVHPSGGYDPLRGFDPGGTRRR
ncbi:flagellar hook-length control protein [Mycolicibacterium sp. Dal123E01]|uniref:flagellar hook-length control protein n=1 Tax=Mycolicibacterium sp. Dal123E01 TaxID=3457578 RepID=UPI00403EB55E